MSNEFSPTADPVSTMVESASTIVKMSAVGSHNELFQAKSMGKLAGGSHSDLFQAKSMGKLAGVA